MFYVRIIKMGAAFSRGELELTMEDGAEPTSAISVSVEAVKAEEAPRGLALHTSALAEQGTVMLYKFDHLVVVVHADGSSQLFDSRQTTLDAIESV